TRAGFYMVPHPIGDAMDMYIDISHGFDTGIEIVSYPTGQTTLTCANATCAGPGGSRLEAKGLFAMWPNSLSPIDINFCP
ncbi:hypothetical protein PENTCL1PPCAC_5028, partial [Pristionchus entomophagus]